MFIHWGLFSVPAGRWKGELVPDVSEWIMRWRRIPNTEYKQLARGFRARDFDAAKWVRMARDAGQKYLIFTAKHHDGFAMYGSASSSYNVVTATPFGRDPLRALARECRKQGIKLCIYYSQSQDWNDPDGMGNDWDFPDENTKDFERYLEGKCRPQLRELLTEYGPVGLVWFDTPKTISASQSASLRRLVLGLQPGCLVNSRLGNGSGDYGCLADNQYPFGKIKGHWETPCTMNESWGFKASDHNWKSARYLIELLVHCAEKGVNLVLNVGPTCGGRIPVASERRLRSIGRWMKVNGKSIHGTDRNPFPHDFQWGGITCRKGFLYLQVLKWPRRPIHLPGLSTRVKSVRLMGAGGQAYPFRQRLAKDPRECEMTIQLPRRRPPGFVPVIVMRLDGGPDIFPEPLQMPDGSLTLPASLASLRRPGVANARAAGYVQGWWKTSISAFWKIRIAHPGTFRVIVQTAMDRRKPGYFGTHEVTARVGRASVTGMAGAKDMQTSEKVNRWHMAESDIGLITIPLAGSHGLTIRAPRLAANTRGGFSLCGIRLVPASGKGKRLTAANAS